MRVALAGVVGAVVPLAGHADPAHATFPGINGRVAAVSEAAARIFTYQLSGDEGSRYVPSSAFTPAGLRELDPAWSPDGRQLAFTRFVNGQADIRVADADGRDSRPLITAPGDDSDPTWSPDGRRIAFTSTRGGDSELYVANADGTAQTPLTNTQGVNQQADWSPVPGQPIAFESTRDGNYELYTIQPDGTGEARVTTDPGRDSDPAWSPDGKQLAFTGAAPGAVTSSIYAISPTGSDRRRLSSTGPHWETTPVWSPDGRKLAFSHNDGYSTSLYVMNKDGTNIGSVPQVVAGFDPVWAPLPPAPSPASSAVPTIGETAFARPLGKVTIKPNGSDIVSPLPAGGLEIPDGTRVDASAPGTAVTVVTAASRNGRTTRTVKASEGAFRFTQAARSSVTTLRLTGTRCAGGGGIHRSRLRVEIRHTAASAAAQQSNITAENGRGRMSKKRQSHVRVKGKYSIAGSFGTVWTTIDRCSSTTTIVHRGEVEVYDRVRRKTVRVRSGERYIARRRHTR